jgi:hypothetical protein
METKTIFLIKNKVFSTKLTGYDEKSSFKLDFFNKGFAIDFGKFGFCFHFGFNRFLTEY